MNAEVLTTEIAAYKPFWAELEELKSENSKLVFDYEDPKSQKEARSHIYKLRQSKSAVEKARKEEKAASLEYGKRVDSEAKKITGAIEEMIEHHAKPIREIEEREQQRIADISSRIDKFVNARQSLAELTSAELNNRIKEVNSLDVDETFAEFLDEARIEKDTTIKVLDEYLAIAVKREEEQEELQRLRQAEQERLEKEREEKIRKEAEDRARQKAQEEADAKVKAAEEQARKAEQEAQRKVQEAEQKAQRERQEQEHLAKQKEHAAAIHNSIANSFMEAGISEGQAKHLVRQIVKGEVPHLQIRY